MTFIIESLFAVFKDFHWLVSIDTLLIFFVNYLMFHAAGRVKISWRLLLLGGLLSVVLTPLLPMGFKFLLNPLILFCFSYYKRPDLPWIEPVFNSFYAWGTTNIIIRGLSLIVFPLLLGADLTSRIPESLTEFICVVVPILFTSWFTVLLVMNICRLRKRRACAYTSPLLLLGLVLPFFHTGF